MGREAAWPLGRGSEPARNHDPPPGPPVGRMLCREHQALPSPSHWLSPLVVAAGPQGLTFSEAELVVSSSKCNPPTGQISVDAWLTTEGHVAQGPYGTAEDVRGPACHYGDCAGAGGPCCHFPRAPPCPCHQRVAQRVWSRGADCPWRRGGNSVPVTPGLALREVPPDPVNVTRQEKGSWRL